MRCQKIYKNVAFFLILRQYRQGIYNIYLHKSSKFKLNYRREDKSSFQNQQSKGHLIPCIDYQYLKKKKKKNQIMVGRKKKSQP